MFGSSVVRDMGGATRPGPALDLSDTCSSPRSHRDRTGHRPDTIPMDPLRRSVPVQWGLAKASPPSLARTPLTEQSDSPRAGCLECPGMTPSTFGAIRRPLMIADQVIRTANQVRQMRAPTHRTCRAARLHEAGGPGRGGRADRTIGDGLYGRPGFTGPGGRAGRAPCPGALPMTPTSPHAWTGA